jgi:hypothetical protein
MALTEESSGSNGFFMPVAPAYGNNGNGMGFGGDWAWILLLLVLFGGWNNNGMGGGFGGGDLYPWMNNSQHISDGFRDQMLGTQISSISDKLTSGFGDIQNALCSGFAGVTNGFNQAQINTMQQMFGIQSALQQCCCDNRAATADLKYTVATEACADRAAVSQGIQTVLDKLCQLELDGYKREADSLRTQLSEARLAASQTAQNALISQGFSNEVDALYNRLNSCPVPTTPVYGRTPIFTCGGNTVGCGCGGNGFMN